MRTTTIGLCAVLALGGCATAASDIRPAYVSAVPYQGLSCEELAAEQVKVRDALKLASNRQNRVRKQDTWTLIFVGLPISSMRGKGVEEQVATLKGADATLTEVQRGKGCAA